MNGFEKELQDRILGVVPHALIHSNKPIANYPQIISELNEDENIDYKKLNLFLKKWGDKPFFIFGFTSYVYKSLIEKFLNKKQKK